MHALGADANRDALRLPPIPYAETIPWLAGTAEQKAKPYLGLLLAPVPFAATPVFAAAPAADRSLFAGPIPSTSRVE
jgi:hypothetical protein